MRPEQPVVGMEGDFRSYRSWRWTLEPGDDFVNDFLLPALVRAKRYDRQAGFFSSSCLLVSAKGIEHLLHRVPRSEWPAYRLIVCERLDEEDIKAIQAGERIKRLEERLTKKMLQALENPVDAAASDRLALLAAMVAVGFAEIRVAVPCDETRRPKAGAIEHTKVAILYDWAGNTLVASGSVNESWTGWVHNNEQMDLYASWEEPTWSRYGEPKVDRFQRLWEGRDPRALTLDLPRAVRERLISLAPTDLPPELVCPVETDDQLLTPVQEAIVLQFLRDAPHMPDGRAVAMTTAAVTPWPHHVGIVSTATAAREPKFLLCDEVGLGKTIEAAFIIRQLRLEGRGRRVLILAPRSLCEQWQGELLNKFSLVAAFYDGDNLIYPDLDGHGPKRIPVDRRKVFEIEDGILIAGTELMRRQDRQGDLLEAPPWDLVVVDEAHHARRKGFDRDDRGPNRLLALLQELSKRTRGLLLLTATPMQVDPREVWDLLRLLGLRGPFAQSFNKFQRYYTLLAELMQKGANRATLDGLFNTIRSGAEADDTLLQAVRERDRMAFQLCETAVDMPVVRERLTRLAGDQRDVLHGFLMAYAPTRQRLFRTTRERLRLYRREGLIRENVPKRHVLDESIPLTPAEREVYRAVEKYLSRHYQNARTGGQRGLGFVLTCYRKRLASSPYALLCSLERLNARLGKGGVRAADLLDADDDFADEADLRQEEVEEDAEALVEPQALRELDDLLTSLRRLTIDTKMARLQEILDDLFRTYPRVIIFTQYKDTMDYLREHLLLRTTHIGCFSGRGAEVYDPSAEAFITISKQELQERLRQDDGIHILVCTDAAAEGLNLQVCGALVNYDMPWNPMRVEQRIGRIDRIGQLHPEVTIFNLFATPTVEDLVYRALKNRINLFEQFIGPLQPILGTMQRTIRDLAMMDPDEREVAQVRALEKLKHRLEELEEQSRSVPVSEGFERPVEPGDMPASPVTLDDLKRFCTRSPSLVKKAALRPVGSEIYEIRWKGQLFRITFDRTVAERRLDDALLFTYGHPCFDELVAAANLNDSQLAAEGLRRTRARSNTVLYWSGSRPIRSLTELLDTLEARVKTS